MKTKKRKTSLKCILTRSVSASLLRQSDSGRVSRRGLILGLMMGWSLLGGAGSYAAEMVVQEIYLPMPEAQIYAAFDKQVAYDPTDVNMMSIFSIVVTTPGTVIVYDQWEDGYEANINAPTDGSTQVWGDGNNANGICPGFVSDPSGLPAGTVITLQNEVPAPIRGSTILYDAGDRVGATRAITITRICYENCCRLSSQASAVEVACTLNHGTFYVAPVGVDILANGMFAFVDLLVMADEDTTTVVVDFEGSGNMLVTNTINRGAHGAFMLDHITKGTSVKADKPVQVHMITGDEFNGQFETRSFMLRPREQWSSRYVIPVGTVDPNYPGFAYVFNPNATALSVGFTSRTSSGSFSVPGTNGLYAFPLPMDSATLLISPDESPFFVICLMNTDPVGENGADMEWGFTPLPIEGLTTEIVCGWGPGSDMSHPEWDGSHNGNPVWITAVSDTTLFIDFDGDGLNVTNVAVSAFEVIIIADTVDNDQTGLRVYTKDGALIAGVWGQNPLESEPGPPYFDIGYTLPPFPIPVLSKSVKVFVDTSPLNMVNKGDILEYTLRVDNKGLLPLVNIPVIDNVPTQQLEYVEGTTLLLVDEVLLSIPDDIPNEINPDFNTPFPLDGGGGYTITNVVLPKQSVSVSFQCKVIGTGLIRNGFSTVTNIVESVVLASIGATNVLEGNTGEQDLVFTVTLDGVAESDMSINFATSDGTALVSNNDYVASNGVLVILAGEMSGIIIVKVIGDLDIELDETLFVTLSNPVGCEIGVAEAVGTIINDDFPVVYDPFLHLFYNVTWVFNPRRDSWYGTLMISNDVESTEALASPVWYDFKKTVNHHIRFPTGIVPSAPLGWFYLDISQAFNAKLPSVGNGDAFLDPGESIILSNAIEMWGRGAMTGYEDWVEGSWILQENPPPFVPFDSNNREYVAGVESKATAPTFQINIKPCNGCKGGVEICWEGQMGLIYTVLRSTNGLARPSFTPVTPKKAGDGTQMTYTDFEADSHSVAFYQVEAEAVEQ